MHAGRVRRAHLQRSRGAAGHLEKHSHQRSDAAAKRVARNVQRPRGKARGSFRKRVSGVAVDKRGRTQHAFMHMAGLLARASRQVHRNWLGV
jgi:hypothetical protein